MESARVIKSADFVFSPDPDAHARHDPRIRHVMDMYARAHCAKISERRRQGKERENTQKTGLPEFSGIFAGTVLAGLGEGQRRSQKRPDKSRDYCAFFCTFFSTFSPKLLEYVLDHHHPTNQPALPVRVLASCSSWPWPWP